jgi:hypothetical protein
MAEPYLDVPMPRIAEVAPRAISVTAEWSLERDGDTPTLVVTLDFGDLEGAGGVDSWQFGGVLSAYANRRRIVAALACNAQTSSSSYRSNQLAGLLTIWCPLTAIHNSNPA